MWVQLTKMWACLEIFKCEIHPCGIVDRVGLSFRFVAKADFGKQKSTPN